MNVHELKAAQVMLGEQRATSASNNNGHRFPEVFTDENENENSSYQRVYYNVGITSTASSSSPLVSTPTTATMSSLAAITSTLSALTSSLSLNTTSSTILNSSNTITSSTSATNNFTSSSSNHIHLPPPPSSHHQQSSTTTSRYYSTPGEEASSDQGSEDSSFSDSEWALGGMASDASDIYSLYESQSNCIKPPGSHISREKAPSLTDLMPGNSDPFDTSNIDNIITSTIIGKPSNAVNRVDQAFNWIESSMKQLQANQNNSNSPTHQQSDQQSGQQQEPELNQRQPSKINKDFLKALESKLLCSTLQTPQPTKPQ